MAKIHKAEEGLLTKAIHEEEEKNLQKETFEMNDNKVSDPDLARLVVQRHKQNCFKRTVRGFISVTAHIMTIAALCTLLWVLSKPNIQNRLKLIIAMAGVAIICYIVIFIEANFSNTLVALRNYSFSKTIHNYVGEVYHARPSITWHATCYHYGSEVNPDKESLTGYDVQGKNSGKKVVSYEEKQEFEFTNWKEVGRDIRDFVSNGIIRLQCSKLFIFRNEESKANYMQQYSQFRERVAQMDRFVQHHEEFSIEGYQDTLTAGFSSAGRPTFMREVWFWISTALLLTWLYRALFRMFTKKIYIIFIKEIGV